MEVMTGTDSDDDCDPVELASPPCLLSEIGPSYFGYLAPAELIVLLNLLLECERAGAQGVLALSRRAANAEAQAALHAVAADEARFCAMLTRHIERLGGTPSKSVGAFYDKLMAETDRARQMSLLDRGQGWVVDKLRESLPKIADAALVGELQEMLTVHEINIARARTLETGAGA